MGKVHRKILEIIREKLKASYSPIVKKVEIGKEVEIPFEAYNNSRKQYEASEMIKKVSKTVNIPGKGKILAVTEKDTYSKDLNFVFGQAQKPGKIALISLHRLKPEFYE